MRTCACASKRKRLSQEYLIPTPDARYEPQRSSPASPNSQKPRVRTVNPTPSGTRPGSQPCKSRARGSRGRETMAPCKLVPLTVVAVAPWAARERSAGVSGAKEVCWRSLDLTGGRR
ncbi:hypothetical protein CC78DRAFT_582665 [Lojkania enalia]|uniref:Uncharacterized protein n=1 Tax=Lojkania enalia TaxID=147567 RepID=A0A9P4N2A4_9PLEO|nr:hypothetical protein CC78DRAFT_582665 [Didymosphaeria enalia]